MPLESEQLIQYPKTALPYLSFHEDRFSSSTTIREGVIDIPEYLGGGELSIEAFDRSLLQDRVLRYVVLGNHRDAKITNEIDQENPKDDLDLEKNILRLLGKYPETAVFDCVTVLRGLEPIALRLSLTEDGLLTQKQLKFLERYDFLEKIVLGRANSRFVLTESQENTARRTDTKSGTRRPLSLRTRKSQNEVREESQRMQEYDEKLARIKDTRSKEALDIRLQELGDIAQTNPDKLILRELLRGNMPYIGNQKTAIHAMNALVLRSDYLPENTDIPVELIVRVRNAASLALSHSSLTNDNPLGRGAYRAAVDERLMANLRHVRHTTGNPPGNSPSKKKMTPVVPIYQGY